MVVVAVVTMWLCLGCPGDPNAYGGPYVEVTPGIDIDLGDVLADEDAGTQLTLTNIGPRAWELWINEDSYNTTTLTFECTTGENDECLVHESGAQSVWDISIHTFCADNPPVPIILAIKDTVDTDGTNVELDRFTVEVDWNTTGCE
jgi:hypothetical protein